jgi:ABC-type dipeptide/oligopeptide/nickel transport system permease component
MTDKNPLEDLREIRRMMENSSKFLSLSGLSGIFAGLAALGGAWLAQNQIDHFENKVSFYYLQNRMDDWMFDLSIRLVGIALLVLLLAVSFGVLFTWLKAKKQGKKLWTNLSIRLVISLSVPLFFGGLFIAGLFYHDAFVIIPATTLLVYGMALLNASKYVHQDIKILALAEMALGIYAIFDFTFGMYGLILGFGIFHILYGTLMYFKYDRK